MYRWCHTTKGAVCGTMRRSVWLFPASLVGWLPAVQGSIDKIARSKRSITGRYLRGDEEIEILEKHRPVTKGAGRRER